MIVVRFERFAFDVDVAWGFLGTIAGPAISGLASTAIANVFAPAPKQPPEKLGSEDMKRLSKNLAIQSVVEGFFSWLYYTIGSRGALPSFMAFAYVATMVKAAFKAFAAAVAYASSMAPEAEKERYLSMLRFAQTVAKI